MEMAWLLHTLLEVRDLIRADPVRHSHACAGDGLSPWGTVDRTNDQSSTDRRQHQRSDLRRTFQGSVHNWNHSVRWHHRSSDF